MLGRSVRCSECGGSGRCAECKGTGRNLHLNGTEPQCRACQGACICAACNGSGIGEISDLSIPLRLAVSTLLALVVCGVLFGRVPMKVLGAAVPPAVGGFVAVVTAGAILYRLWKDVKIADLKPGKPDELESLLAREELGPSDKRQENRGGSKA